MSYETINEIKYYLISNSYYIIGNNGWYTATGVTSKSISGEIVIPEKVKGLDILEVGQWAFYFCTKITKITIHAKLRSINYFAFYGCKKLKYINIPSSVTFIARHSLYLGTGFEKVDLETTIEFVKGRTQKFYAAQGAFTGRNEIKIIYPSNLVPLYDSNSKTFSSSSSGNSSAIICAPSLFDFCGKQTTIGFSQCPPASYVDPNAKGKTFNVKRKLICKSLFCKR